MTVIQNILCQIKQYGGQRKMFVDVHFVQNAIVGSKIAYLLKLVL